MDSILNHFQGYVPQELAHELYVYQSYVMNLVEGRMKKRFTPGDLKGSAIITGTSFLKTTEVVNLVCLYQSSIGSSLAL